MTFQIAVQVKVNNIKERIVFIQHMPLHMTEESMSDIFGKYGKLTKCEQLLQGKDMWMLQYSTTQACPFSDRAISCCNDNVPHAVALVVSECVL